MIVPIIMLMLTLLGGGATLIFIKRNSMKKEEEINRNLETAQEFINVQDIKGNFLYSKDKYIFAYVKINPISIELISKRERKGLCDILTSQLSSEQNKFRFLAVSRPIDITPLINDYSNIMLNSDNPKQKELLRREMLFMSSYAMSGEVVERQFYIRLFEKYEEGIEKDLLKRATEFATKFENGKVSCEVLKEQGIIRLCNLINNPAYSHIEDTEYEAAIPFIMGLEEAS